MRIILSASAEPRAVATRHRGLTFTSPLLPFPTTSASLCLLFAFSLHSLCLLFAFSLPSLLHHLSSRLQQQQHRIAPLPPQAVWFFVSRMNEPQSFIFNHRPLHQHGSPYLAPRRYVHSSVVRFREHGIVGPRKKPRGTSCTTRSTIAPSTKESFRHRVGVTG